MSTASNAPSLVKIPAWLVTVIQDASIALEVIEDVTGSKPSGSGGSAPAAGGSSESVLQEVGNLVPKLPTDPLTAGLDAGAAVAQDAGAVISAENTPIMQAGRLNVAVQKYIAKNSADGDEAQKTGNATKVDQDLSP